MERWEPSKPHMLVSSFSNRVGQEDTQSHLETEVGFLLERVLVEEKEQTGKQL